VALRNLNAIERRIARDRPVAAVRFVDRLWAAGQGLSEKPERGKPTASGMRELTTVRPYLIRYYVRENRVVIAEVRHGARRRKP